MFDEALLMLTQVGVIGICEKAEICYKAMILILAVWLHDHSLNLST